MLAMDDSNYDELDQTRAEEPSGTRSAGSSISRRMTGTQRRARSLLSAGAEGFDHALDLIEEAARGLLAELLAAEARPAKKGA